jgi:hypothetical protein
MEENQLLHPHGELSGIEMMIDIIHDQSRRLKRDLDDITEACLHWKVDPETNSIALILWHIGRLLDVFFNQHALGKSPEETCWFKCGWAERTSYDPRGRGRDDWGTLNQYNLEELAEIPRFKKADLIGFIDDVYHALEDYLRSTTMQTLIEPAPGFMGQFTRYQVITMAVMDNIRHLGEIRLVKSLWVRSSEGGT